MSKKSSVKVTPSSGNVFRDVGFSREEAGHLAIRAHLLIQLQKLIASRGLKQAEVAKLLWVTQPRVSDLLRGRIDLFSTVQHRLADRYADEMWCRCAARREAFTLSQSRVAACWARPISRGKGESFDEEKQVCLEPSTVVDGGSAGRSRRPPAWP